MHNSSYIIVLSIMSLTVQMMYFHSHSFMIGWLCILYGFYTGFSSCTNLSMYEIKEFSLFKLTNISQVGAANKWNIFFNTNRETSFISYRPKFTNEEKPTFSGPFFMCESGNDQVLINVRGFAEHGNKGKILEGLGNMKLF